MYMHVSKPVVVVAWATAALTLSSTAHADLIAVTDVLDYQGTTTTYNTLADAQAGTNATGTYNVDRRDAALYQTPTGNIFMTAWYYTTNVDNGEYSGWGNPNNTNTGFIQMYDYIDGVAPPVTQTSASGGWVDNSFEEFTYSMAGENADADQFARWWHAPGVGGAASLTAGTFVEYSLDVTFGFDGGAAVTEVSPGMWNTGDFNTSVTGTFTAIFENTNTTDTAYNQFYVIELTLGFDPNTHWAWSNSDDLFGAFSASEFEGGLIPAPGALALLGLAGLAGRRRRRCCA